MDPCLVIRIRNLRIQPDAAFDHEDGAGVVELNLFIFFLLCILHPLYDGVYHGVSSVTWKPRMRFTRGAGAWGRGVSIRVIKRTSFTLAQDYVICLPPVLVKIFSVCGDKQGCPVK